MLGIGVSGHRDAGRVLGVVIADEDEVRAALGELRLSEGRQQFGQPLVARGTPDEDGAERVLLLVGDHDAENTPGVSVAGHANPEHLRNIYASADVLVMPAIDTRSIREPWGLVANEAMNQGLPVIATDAVGAPAGGLVRDNRNGIIVPAGDASALAGALNKLNGDRQLRERLGSQARQDVSAYSFSAWADGFSDAFRSLGIGGRSAW